MMMLRTADGGAVVHALDMGTRKPLPRWMWMAIAASAALHVAGGVWLYQRKFETPPLIQTPEEIYPVIKLQPMPPKPKPIERTPPKPPTPVHKAKTPPTAKTPTLPLPPVDTPVKGSDTAEYVPPSPTYDEKSVETKPADVAPPPPPVIANPKWISKPTGEQMARWYPLGALEKEVSGRVVMKCRVTATGSVGNCAVTSEEPAGYGFGEAAIKLSKYFKMSPRTVDGAPVEGAEVSIPLRFGFR